MNEDIFTKMDKVQNEIQVDLINMKLTQERYLDHLEETTSENYTDIKIILRTMMREIAEIKTGSGDSWKASAIKAVMDSDVYPSTKEEMVKSICES